MSSLSVLVSGFVNTMKGSFTEATAMPKLICVDYLPIQRVIKDWVTIDKNSVPDTTYFEVVRNLPNVRAGQVGYVYTLGLEGRVVVKHPTTRLLEYVSIADNTAPTGYRYYKNPNILHLESVLQDAYLESLFYKKGLTSYEDPYKVDWCNTYTDVIEVAGYNFSLQSTVHSVDNLKSNLIATDKENRNILQLHFILANIELGHYYTTFRNKNTNFRGVQLANFPEWCPVLYQFKDVYNPLFVCSGFEDSLEVLNNLFPHTKSASTKDIYLMELEKVIRYSFTGARRSDLDIDNQWTCAVYLTRLDIYLLTGALWDYKTPTNNVTRDGYDFRSFCIRFYSGILRLLSVSPKAKEYSLDGVALPEDVYVTFKTEKNEFDPTTKSFTQNGFDLDQNNVEPGVHFGEYLTYALGRRIHLNAGTMMGASTLGDLIHLKKIAPHFQSITSYLDVVDDMRIGQLYKPELERFNSGREESAK